MLLVTAQISVAARACNPESQSRDPGIHSKSQSRDFELIEIRDQEISHFCQILAIFGHISTIFGM